MESSSKCSKNDGHRRSHSKPVVYKNNLSATFNKKSLRANNKALARALSKKKQEISNLQNDYVKLLSQNNLLRLHLQGHDVELSKFYAEKFAQFRITVSESAKLLHSVCGQLIDISANFENMSEFFQNLQSISLKKPNTSSQNLTTVRRPAQRVIVTPAETTDAREEENVEEEVEEKTAVEANRYLDVIEEEPSHVENFLDEITEGASAVFNDSDDKEMDLDNSHASSFNLNSSASSKAGQACQKLDLLLDDVLASVNSSIHEVEISQQEDFTKNDNDTFVKNKIALSRKKSRASKAGQVKYNACKPDNPRKSRFKSFSTSQPPKPSEEKDAVDTAIPDHDEIGADKINTKEKQSSVYDLSLDDSSYLAPPTLHKGQKIQDQHQLPSVVLDRVDAKCLSSKTVDNDNNGGNDSHGIMLRLGNGTRTKPKGTSKNVRYNESVSAEVDDTSKSKPDEDGSVLSESVQTKEKKTVDPLHLPDVSKKSSNIEVDAVETSSAVSTATRKSGEEEDGDEEAVAIENAKTKSSRKSRVDLPDSRSSVESIRSSVEGNSRKRRAAASVNYKEPSLNIKLRNPHSSSKKGKKSAS